MLEQKDTHVQDGLDNLIGQFKDKPTLEAFLSVYLEQLPELEQAFFDIVKEARNIALSTGVQLDGIGEIVGEKRAGQSDTDYRIGIYTRILINKSSGTVDEILAIMSVANAVLSYTFERIDYANFHLHIDDPVDLSLVNIPLLRRLICEAKLGGVRGILHFYPPTPKTFDDALLGFDAGLFGTALDAC